MFVKDCRNNRTGFNKITLGVSLSSKLTKGKTWQKFPKQLGVKKDYFTQLLSLIRVIGLVC